MVDKTDLVQIWDLLWPFIPPAIGSYFGLRYAGKASRKERVTTWFCSAFLSLFLVFAGLALISLLPGRAVASWSRHFLNQRSAAMVGACVSAGIALLVNVVALVLHTLALNPVSHPLFMQGQIGQTHFNSLVIAMGIELLAVIIFVLGIGFALRSAKKRA